MVALAKTLAAVENATSMVGDHALLPSWAALPPSYSKWDVEASATPSEVEASATLMLGGRCETLELEALVEVLLWGMNVRKVLEEEEAKIVGSFGATC